MKIQKHGLNTPSTALESTKAGKSESARGLNKNSLNAKDLTSPSELRDASRVDVSNYAQQLQKAKEIAGNQTVDEAKVARLQKLIDEGKYHVDADKVADRLVDSHMDFSE